ncbi:hypothetical protein [Chitinophaga sancti]|uniref:Uncharacterized protein n=1 Tax=Chitinophaga sancti TaxID=1004 RepID=A0A1K1SNP7_9BACT|nr:hypothetical protein [Chitinophaga sancti]WQD60053.1 hypothetical protein U0033_19375 [Chitinophaga sancti]WQG87818.1 hypothetical protein SR876_23095 [Chitinophaga sancti]SFW85836.1 hypothetical protein SAMN05661012_05797 [Chitinophaga sancti]
MFPSAIKVKNVNVYPYANWPGYGVGPALTKVIEGASGVYSVGTLFTNVMYNLSLSGGKELAPLVVHESYVAIGETEYGVPFTSHWVYCLQAGPEPTFGLTINAYYVPFHYVPGSYSTPPYFPIAALTDITVSQLFAPPAIGQKLLIVNGTGNIIATKTGTPHEMGVEVTSGHRVSPLAVGLQGILITGKTKDGHLISFNSLTCTDAGEPAVFLRQLA